MSQVDPLPAPCPASSFLPAPSAALVRLSHVNGSSGTARPDWTGFALSRLASHTANFGASFKTLISRIDNDTETASSSRSRQGSSWVAMGQATEGEGPGQKDRKGQRAQSCATSSCAADVRWERFKPCRSEGQDQAGPNGQAAAHSSHSWECRGGAWRVGGDTVLIHPFAVAVRVCSWLYPVALAGNLFGTRPLPLCTLPRAELLHPVGQVRFNVRPPLPAPSLHALKLY